MGPHPRLGERIQERALARVGVAHQRHDGHPRAAPSLLAPVPPHLLDAPLQRLDLGADQAAVGFELRLTGAAQADRALHPLQVRPLPRQTRQQVLVLRQRDLQAALVGAGALREDVQD